MTINFRFFLFYSKTSSENRCYYNANFNYYWEDTNFFVRLNLAVLESSFQMINQYNLVIWCVKSEGFVSDKVYDPALYFETIIE